MTAGIAIGLAGGDSVLDAVRLGAGAGILNVTRHGLGTGRREHIERFSRHVELRRFPETLEPESRRDGAREA